MKLSPRARCVALWVLVGSLASVAFLNTVDGISLSFDGHHHGIQFIPSQQMLRGAVPFRDVSQHYGLGSQLVNALFLLLFDQRLIAIAFATAVAFAGSYLLLVVLWRQALGGPLAVAALAAFFLWAPASFWPWPNYIALFFKLGSLLALLKWSRQRRQRFLFIAGVLLAMVFMARQQTGVLLLVPVACWIVWVEMSSGQSIRTASSRILGLCLGIVTILGSVLAFLWWVDAAEDWYIQTVRIVPDYYGDAFGLPTGLGETVLDVGRSVLSTNELGVVILGFCAAAIPFFAVRSLRAPEDPFASNALLLIAAVTLSCAAETYPLGGKLRWHCAIAQGIAIPFCLLSAEFFGRSRKSGRREALAVVVLAAAAAVTIAKQPARYFPFAFGSGFRYSSLFEPQKGAVDHLLAGFEIDPGKMKFYRDVEQLLNGWRAKRPNIPLVNLLGDPIPVALAAESPPLHKLYLVYASSRWLREAVVRTKSRESPLFSQPYLASTANLRLYPDYFVRLREAARRERPVILGTPPLVERISPEGYRVAQRWSNAQVKVCYYHSQFGPDNDVVIAVPAELLP